MSTRLRYMKEPRCSMPAVRNMVDKELYVDTSHADGQMVAAMNKMVASYEHRLKDAPRADELEGAEKVVKGLTNELQALRKKIAEQEESIKDQGRYIRDLDVYERTLKDELRLSKNEVEMLREGRKAARTEIVELNDLLAKMTANRSTDIRRAV